MLARLTCPLGEMNKDQARREARRLGLPNWNKPDSQELCFVPDGDVRAFVGRERANAGRRGPLLDEAGHVLGEHAGIEGFTVGQRRGIGIAAGEPRYVLHVLPERQAVIVGPAPRLLGRALRAEQAAWVGPPPQEPFEAQVKIRYRHAPAAARISPCEGGFTAEFAEPQRAIAPGQAAVVYQGAHVVGGGLIAAALPV